MRHVDEGTIHAWLDGQVNDAAEAAWIEEHCRTCEGCRARLADERAAFQQADALLASVAPAADGGRPAFEALVATAAAASPDPDTAPAPVRGPSRSWLLAAGWAASVTLAAVLGWTVRDGVPARAEDPVQQLPARDQRDDMAAAAPSTAPAAPAAKSVPEESVSVEMSTGSASAREQVSPSPRTAAGRTEPSSPAADVTPSGSASKPAGAGTDTAATAVQERTLLEYYVAPPIFQTPEASVIETSTARGGRGGRAGGGGRAGRAGGGGGGGSGSNVAAAPPPPAAALPSRGAALGESETGRVSTPVLATPPPPPLAASPPDAGLSQGRVQIDGVSLADAVQFRRDATEWRQLPRTEAAARSGMPLYGIAGMTPFMTMLSADGATVRTFYKVGTGEIELLQQRADAAPPPPPAAPGLAGGAGSGALARQQLAPLTASLSFVRGDVTVTLRGDADLAALGERLQLD